MSKQENGCANAQRASNYAMLRAKDFETGQVFYVEERPGGSFFGCTNPGGQEGEFRSTQEENE